MSGLTLIPLDSAPPQPWRNGGGITRELFTWPADGPWRLRISVADIHQDGPFSAYPGIDRWFAVLQGAGVRLLLPAGPVTLLAGGDPLHFAGELAPACTLLHGPTRDLNLMLRREVDQSHPGHAGGMQRVVPDQPWTSPAALRALFCAEPIGLHTDGAPPRPPAGISVPAFTLAVSTQAAHKTWCASATSATPQAWWMHFAPAPARAATARGA